MPARLFCLTGIVIAALALLAVPPSSHAEDFGAPNPGVSTLESARARLSELTIEIQAYARTESRLSARLHSFSSRLTIVSDRLARLRREAESVPGPVLDPTGQRENLRAYLSFKTQAERRLERARMQQDRLVRTMRAHPLVPLLADVQVLLNQLAEKRREALAIVAELDAAEQSQALATLAAATQGTASIPYGDWAARFLDQLGVPACQDNLAVVVAWQVAEGTQAAWNPLATSWPLPGATVFNGYGVRNYASLEDGLTASVRTVRLRTSGLGYDWIVYRLSQCAPAELTAEAINASAWCRGCAGGEYVLNVLAEVEARYELYARL